MEKKLRQYKSILVCCAWGCVLLCAWNVIDTMLSWYNIPTMVDNYLAQAHLAINNYSEADVADTVTLIVKLAYVVLLVITILLRLFIARSAILVGKGKKNKTGYLVLCVFLMIAIIATFIINIQSFKSTTYEATIISLIFEAISFFIVCEAFVVSILIKSTQKKIAASKAAVSGE